MAVPPLSARESTRAGSGLPNATKPMPARSEATAVMTACSFASAFTLAGTLSCGISTSCGTSTAAPRAWTTYTWMGAVVPAGAHSSRLQTSRA